MGSGTLVRPDDERTLTSDLEEWCTGSPPLIDAGDPATDYRTC
jgi:hypothetical protein